MRKIILVIALITTFVSGVAVGAWTLAGTLQGSYTENLLRKNHVSNLADDDRLVASVNFKENDASGNLERMLYFYQAQRAFRAKTPWTPRSVGWYQDPKCTGRSYYYSITTPLFGDPGAVRVFKGKQQDTMGWCRDYG